MEGKKSANDRHGTIYAEKTTFRSVFDLEGAEHDVMDILLGMFRLKGIINLLELLMEMLVVLARLYSFSNQ